MYLNTLIIEMEVMKESSAMVKIEYFFSCITMTSLWEKMGKYDRQAKLFEDCEINNRFFDTPKINKFMDFVDRYEENNMKNPIDMKEHYKNITLEERYATIYVLCYDKVLVGMRPNGVFNKKLRGAWAFESQRYELMDAITSNNLLIEEDFMLWHSCIYKLYKERHKKFPIFILSLLLKGNEWQLKLMLNISSNQVNFILENSPFPECNRKYNYSYESLQIFNDKFYNPLKTKIIPHKIPSYDYILIREEIRFLLLELIIKDLVNIIIEYMDK
jgi:hypothetical protein